MSEGFLSRWARRKEAVRTVERTVAPTAPPPAADAACDRDAHAVAADSSAPAPLGEAETLRPALPSLETLTAETDLAPFLRAGVPAALRNAALRRMWSLDPAIRDFVSEAREYAYDWNTPGGVPGLGPLLPSDDVQAMLRRLIGTPGGPPADEQPVDAAIEAEARTTSEVAEVEAAEVPEEAAAVLPAPDPVSIEARPTAEPVAPLPPRPRLRRHGGAMPA